MVARCWGVGARCPTDEPREQDAGDHWHLSVLPGTYPSGQRCCAASASHSGKTKGARPSPPLPTSLAPTDVDELSVKLMSIGRPLQTIGASRSAYSIVGAGLAPALLAPALWTSKMDFQSGLCHLYHLYRLYQLCRLYPFVPSCINRWIFGKIHKPFLFGT